MKNIVLFVFILVVCNFAQASKPRQYFFMLNFDNSLLYVDDTRSQIIDSRILIKEKVQRLAENCIDCSVTIVEKDTSIESKRLWNQKRIVRKKQEIQVFRYEKNRLSLKEKFKDLAQALTILGFSKAPSSYKYFYYFGHSLRKKKKDKEITFSEVISFLDKITKHQNKLELIVFSSCSNGNIQTLLDFAPYSNFIIAAPSEIHLSMLNISDFKFGFENYIDNSFANLSRVDRTEVSISLYDSNKFLNELKNSKNLSQLYENRSSYIRYNRYKKPQFGISHLRFKDIF